MDCNTSVQYSQKKCKMLQLCDSDINLLSYSNCSLIRAPCFHYLLITFYIMPVGKYKHMMCCDLVPVREGF